MAAGSVILRLSRTKARVVSDALVPTALTGINVAAKRRSAAVLDRRHDLELGQAQVAPPIGAIVGAFHSEDIGDLERGAQAGSAAGILALHQPRQTLKRTGH